jgi:hypothetical protein
MTNIKSEHTSVRKLKGGMMMSKMNCSCCSNTAESRAMLNCKACNSYMCKDCYDINSGYCDDCQQSMEMYE